MSKNDGGPSDVGGGSADVDRVNEDLASANFDVHKGKEAPSTGG